MKRILSVLFILAATLPVRAQDANSVMSQVGREFRSYYGVSGRVVELRSRTGYAEQPDYEHFFRVRYPDYTDQVEQKTNSLITCYNVYNEMEPREWMKQAEALMEKTMIPDIASVSGSREVEAGYSVTIRYAGELTATATVTGDGKILAVTPDVLILYDDFRHELPFYTKEFQVEALSARRFYYMRELISRRIAVAARLTAENIEQKEQKLKAEQEAERIEKDSVVASLDVYDMAEKANDFMRREGHLVSGPRNIKNMGMVKVNTISPNFEPLLPGMDNMARNMEVAKRSIREASPESMSAEEKEFADRNRRTILAAIDPLIREYENALRNPVEAEMYAITFNTGEIDEVTAYYLDDMTLDQVHWKDRRGGTRVDYPLLNAVMDSYDELISVRRELQSLKLD